MSDDPNDEPGSDPNNDPNGAAPFFVRNTRPEDFADIERISRATYPNDAPWSAEHLRAHQEVFPEGQFVVVERATGRVVGTAISLIIRWDDYDRLDDYNTFTAAGYLTNHDPTGRTLYGAEVMVDPAYRGHGLGSMLYEARRALVERLGLLRIRAGARLPGYHRYAAEMDARAYVDRVVAGEIYDATLTFQLRRGFRVLAVVPDYAERDVRSRGYAALIEWRNPNAPDAQTGASSAVGP